MSSIKKWFQDKVGIGENRDRFAVIEQKINFNSVLINNLLPNVFTVDLERYPVDILKEHQLEGTISLDIHKNDLMFLINVFKKGDFHKSLNAYFRIGYSTSEFLKNVLAESSKKSGTSISNFLDFGSGYGRVTRFLPQALGKNVSIYASEIKSEAVQFCQNQLGFQGIHHGSQANSFPSDQKFDAIFAGSIFSHLPEKMMVEWLQKLVEVLNDKGVLIFTTHNATMLSENQNVDFHYTTLSEDAVLDMVSNHLSDDSEYGTAYVSDKKITEHMADLQLSFEIKRKAFGNRQDVVVAHRK